ncbi:MAG: histone deacetylase [Anaerolineales bacterium]|nr:histone deacetylase [Anaerolineales bacterium]
MKAFTADSVSLPLPEGHRFPAEKYSRLRRRIESEGAFAAIDLCLPEPATEAQLALVHSPEYIQAFRGGTLSEREIRRIGLPWSLALVERSLRSVGGTMAACQAAALDGLAIHLGGGTHHAFPVHGAGYCVFNDCAVAARHLQAQQIVARILILDLDVHQGDGTAAIFAGDTTVYTCSLHSMSNFPFRKQTSDLDVALADGTGDEDYLQALQHALDIALPASRPDLVLYIAGADPYAGDTLGRLSISIDGLAERDRFVFDAMAAAGLPVAVVLGGGYARRIDDTVQIHVNTVARACQRAAGPTPAHAPVGRNT